MFFYVLLSGGKTTRAPYNNLRLYDSEVFLLDSPYPLKERWSSSKGEHKGDGVAFTNADSQPLACWNQTQHITRKAVENPAGGKRPPLHVLWGGVLKVPFVMSFIPFKDFPDIR